MYLVLANQMSQTSRFFISLQELIEFPNINQSKQIIKCVQNFNFRYENMQNGTKLDPDSKKLRQNPIFFNFPKK